MVEGLAETLKSLQFLESQFPQQKQHEVDCSSWYLWESSPSLSEKWLFLQKCGGHLWLILQAEMHLVFINRNGKTFVTLVPTAAEMKRGSTFQRSKSQLIAAPSSQRLWVQALLFVLTPSFFSIPARKSNANCEISPQCAPFLLTNEDSFDKRVQSEIVTGF